MHDAILVGIGTALNDDPQLNTRHLPPSTDGSRYHLPRPVIVDTNLRLSPTCKLLRNYQNGQGRRPWILCVSREDDEWRQRSDSLEKAGATIIQVEVPASEQDISVNAILRSLRQRGVQTLMVEGGARIIASFFQERSTATGKPIVDTIIVTVAPILVGDNGVGYGVEDLTPSYEHIRTDLVGKDAVIVMSARE